MQWQVCHCTNTHFVILDSGVSILLAKQIAGSMFSKKPIKKHIPNPFLPAKKCLQAVRQPNLAHWLGLRGRGIVTRLVTHTSHPTDQLCRTVTRCERCQHPHPSTSRHYAELPRSLLPFISSLFSSDGRRHTAMPALAFRSANHPRPTAPVIPPAECCCS